MATIQDGQPSRRSFELSRNEGARMEALEQSRSKDETIEVTIIIPTRDRREDLERCLAALAEQT